MVSSGHQSKSKKQSTSGKGKFFGTALIAEGVIDNTQLENALKVQKQKQTQYGENALLGMIVVELGYASEDAILTAINEQFNILAKSLNDNIAQMTKSESRSIPLFRVPIWLQFSIAVTLIIVIVIVTLSMLNLERQKANLYHQTSKIGMVSLNYFSNNARIPLLENNYLQLNMLLNEAISVEELKYAMIIDRKNSIIAHTDTQEMGKTFHEILRKDKVIKKGDVVYFNYVNENGERILNLTRPVTFRDKQLGTVQVGVSIDFIETIIEEERQYNIFLMLISITIGIFIAILLGRHFSRPISQLVMATNKIAAGDYQHRVHLGRKDELGDLAKAFNEMSQELWLKVLMQNTFGKYVGADVLKMIIENPSESWLKGKRSDATVIFTDIRGFTAYCESKDPAEVVEHINQYFSIVSQVILEQGGYVDKFIGDAVLGVFGVPVYHSDHMQRAVIASLLIQQKLAEAGDASGNALLKKVGIGINVGVVVSGNIGSEVKMEYTVIGNTVNLASRFNHLAAEGEIIMGENINKALNYLIESEALAPRKIKGVSGMVTTYKLLGLKS